MSSEQSRVSAHSFVSFLLVLFPVILYNFAVVVVFTSPFNMTCVCLYNVIHFIFVVVVVIEFVVAIVIFCVNFEL